MMFFGQFPANLRLQYSDQYNLTIKRQLPGDILFQIGYVGSQGHRLLASYEINIGNPTTCNQLNTILGDWHVRPIRRRFRIHDSGRHRDSGRRISIAVQRGSGGLTVPAGTACESDHAGRHAAILLAALSASHRRGLPVRRDARVFRHLHRKHRREIELQLAAGSRAEEFSHGLQFQASYTLSKTMDNASSFESALNPLNFNATYGLSATTRATVSSSTMFGNCPMPKYDGFKGKLLDGWEVSGIVSFQSGFPIRITSQDDVEELDSTDFLRISRRAQPDGAVPHAKHPPEQWLRLQSRSVHERDRCSRHHRQRAALDLLRPRHQQLGHELEQRDQARRALADGIPRRHLQHLESRAVLQRGWRRLEHWQHVRPGAARSRSAAGPVLAQVQVLARTG